MDPQSRPIKKTSYELLSLRDADSSNPDRFHQFGIMTDTYLPKAAYAVVKAGNARALSVEPTVALQGISGRRRRPRHVRN